MWWGYHCICLLVAFAISVKADSPVVASTTTGKVVGVLSDDGYAVWKGIPYAEAPIGKNRFAPPIPKESWAPSTRNATEFGFSCPQDYFMNYAFPQSEDCLVLNVWAPVNYTDAPLPVMVWIYGGSWVQGLSNYPLYYGDYYANSSQIVLVSINYRIGALGFLSGNGLTGNYGIMDQQLALKWVQNNIANFGGDPNQVTIFGQSAGAMSVSVHLTTPSSYGLFQRAIMQSNPAGLEFRTAKQNIEYSDIFALNLGCKVGDVNCLRNASVPEILKSQDATIGIPWPVTARQILPWQPIIDGELLVDQPINLFSKGQIAPNVSVIIGTNRNETVIFVYYYAKFVILPFEYVAAIELSYGANAATILEMYPAPTDPNADSRPILSLLTSDFLFTCPARKIAAELQKHQLESRLYYFLNSPVVDPMNPNNPVCVGNVCHGAELQFVFHSAEFLPKNQFYNGSFSELSWNMLDTWSTFAHGKDVSQFWPVYDTNTDEAMLFDIDIGTIQDYRKSQCDFWDSLY